MGAHNTATRDVARQRVEYIRDLLATGEPAAQRWAERIERVLEAPSGGTLKAWMQSHHGEDVETLQASMSVIPDEPVTAHSLWAPGPRRVDAARATKVLLDSSTREYAGVTTYVATEDTYIGFATWGQDAVQMVVYVR